LFDNCIFNYEIMPATLANTFCSFNKIVQQQISGLVVDLWCAWLQLISACNSERIIEIGQCLPKLCANKKGPVSLTQAYTGLPISTSWRDVSCGWRYLSRLDLLTGRRSAFVRYSRNESRNECGHPLPKKNFLELSVHFSRILSFKAPL